MLRTSLTSQAIDDVLAGTFPASDPPAWTPGMARPAPEIATPTVVTSPQVVFSVLGAAGIALLFPLAIVAVGTPVALAVRGLLEVAQWFVR